MIQRIGDKYTIKGYLGAGAWKMAYRAASTDRQQDVAVIVFKDKNASVEETIREASTLSNLTRSNHEYVNYIADFYGFDYDSNLQSVVFC